MQKVIFISGTMGSGKTTISRLCNEKLSRSVWLDGDWCWMMSPFQVQDQTKAMVMDNIVYLLNQFLAQACFDHVLFSWVMDQQKLSNKFTIGCREISRFITSPCCLHQPSFADSCSRISTEVCGQLTVSRKVCHA